MHAVSHRSVGPYRIEQTGDEVVFQLVRPAWSPLRFNLFYAATLGLVCLAGAAYEARGWESLHFAALAALTVAWAILNHFAGTAFDVYPYTFFNLVLAILVALQGPLIVMSQNRAI